MGIFNTIFQNLGWKYIDAMLANETAQRVHLGAAEREQNEFNASQAQMQRDFESTEAEKTRQFNSTEAERARMFQTQFYEDYQSPEAMMRQYQAAGLNPALMYQGAGSPNSPVSSSAASSVPPVGVAATGVGGNAAFDKLFGNISAFSQIEKMLAETDLIKSQTQGQDITNKYLDELNSAQIEQIKRAAEKYAADTKTTDATRNALVEYYETMSDKNLSEARFSDANAFRVYETTTAEVRKLTSEAHMLDASTNKLYSDADMTKYLKSVFYPCIEASISKNMEFVDKQMQNIDKDIMQKDFVLSVMNPLTKDLTAGQIKKLSTEIDAQELQNRITKAGLPAEVADKYVSVLTDLLKGATSIIDIVAAFAAPAKVGF